MLKKQRPASRVTKYKISIYTGGSRAPCCELDRDIDDMADELLCMTSEPGSYGETKRASEETNRRRIDKKQRYLRT